MFYVFEFGFYWLNFEIKTLLKEAGVPLKLQG